MYIRGKWRNMEIKKVGHIQYFRQGNNKYINFQNRTPWHVTSLNIILFYFIHIMTGIPSANCTFLWRAKLGWVTPRLAGRSVRSVAESVTEVWIPYLTSCLSTLSHKHEAHLWIPLTVIRFANVKWIYQPLGLATTLRESKSPYPHKQT